MEESNIITASVESENVPQNVVFRKKRKISLFYLSLGFIFLFCFMTMTFWYINAKSSRNPINVYILTGKGSTSFTTVTTTSKPAVTTRSQCTSIPELERLDCYPEALPTEAECSTRGCCYHSNIYQQTRTESYLPALGIPVCFYPSDYVGYIVSTVTHTDSGLNATLERSTSSGFAADVKKLNLVVTPIDCTSFRIKITDYNNVRYEAPLYQDVKYQEIDNSKRLFDVDLSSDGMLSVTRRSSRTQIFSTDLTYMVYSNQFLQLTSKLSSNYIYGLGEHYSSLLKSTNWTRLTFFNKDNFPGPGLNLYGTQPFYLALESDGKSHGVFLLNSNAMDVVLQPLPSITYRSIGGIFDFFIFLGPSPSQVVEQYTNLVGRSLMPPYWGLGFHLSKYGYNSVEGTRKVYERTKQARVPYDAQWNDIDYMDRKNDFSYDKINFKELPEFIEELHSEGMHYVIIFDPGVSNNENPGTYHPFDDGIEKNVFIKNSTDGIFVGKVWNPISTVFPDFTHPNSTLYWTEQFKYFHDSINFDGAWIDMNEISNFYYNGTVNGCPKASSLENPQYLPGGRVPLCTQTLCMTAKHFDTVHYNEHNVYGYREAIATNLAMQEVTGKRPFVISRSTFAGQGQFSGHWSGDIASTWDDMRYSIINMLNFNMFGIPLVGSDICGFRLSTTPELCARWFSLGSFYPFARNHNDIDRVEQDPVALGTDVLNAAYNLYLRYSLLPYLYYLFYRSHVYGEPVVRPLFFEFPNDPDTYNIDEQFLWGSSIMIVPVVYENMREVVAYFPQGIWYNLDGEKRVSKGERFTLPAPLDKINVVLRSGIILATQQPNTTTTKSRLNDFELYIALDSEKGASGELYWDDGETIGTYENSNFSLIAFHYEKNVLTSKVVSSGYNETQMILGSARIFGLESEPKNNFITINGVRSQDYSWENTTEVLSFMVNLTLMEPITVLIE